MQDSEDHPIQKQSDIYKRIKLLGSGSYGRAFLVKEISTGELWVIKQINLADLSPDEQEAAMKQAKILELLKHHNIVRFKQVYRTAKGKLNIVMEYAEGGDLSHRIKAAKAMNAYFTEEEILNWFVQICLGIKHLHDSKIIHRDLKSQNIFLTSQNLVKIGDFGVAKIMENTVAKARTVVGSPYYLSPQIVQSRPYSFKTDIWSLGTLLFELCALHPPFSATSLQSLALKIVQGAYVQIPKQYSQGLRNLIKWMLQTKEALRPNIHQIILSSIVATRINKFISESQRLQPANHKSGIAQISSLKPPPDLLALENVENRSEVVISKNFDKQVVSESPIKVKAKTPQIGVKKGPNNFFSRPGTGGKRKVEAPNDLAGLIQIKPSVIQAHEKPQKMLLPLPKVPKTSPTNFVKQKLEVVKQKQVPIPKPNSAFVKKRTSFTQLEGFKRDEVKSAVILTGRKSEVKKQKEKIEPIKQEKEKKKSQVKTQIRKKPTKQVSQTKLQICSEQIKKKEMVPPKQEKKVEKKKEKVTKRQATQQVQPKIQQIMQEQKCNSEQDLNSNPSAYSYYDEQSFQSYSSGSISEVDLQFSETLSERAKKQNNYQSMVKEMEKIKHIIDNGENLLDSLPNLGQSIPELLEYSTKPRVDDDEQPEQTASQQSKFNYSQSIRNPQEDLQSLRVNLELIFGVEHIIYAYHKIEEKINLVGLGLDEAETIAEIISEKPQIDEALLAAYFRLIVTIVGMEMRLLD